jgi:hypothetical protein
MGWPSRASIECTDHILVYGLKKPSSLSLKEAWLKPTATQVVRGEKLGRDLEIISRRAGDIVRNLCFSGPVGFVQICQ